MTQSNATIKKWLADNGFNGSYRNDTIRQFTTARNEFDEEVARLSTLADYREDLETTVMSEPVSLLAELEVKEDKAEREYQGKIQVLKNQLEQVKTNYTDGNATSDLIVNIHDLLVYSHNEHKKFKIVDILSSFFKSLNFDMSTKPMFRFQTYNTDGALQQKNIPLTIDTIKRILNQLEQLVIVDEIKEEFVYEAGELPFPSIRTLLRFTIIPFDVAYPNHKDGDERKAYKTNGGSFFQFFFKSDTDNALKDTLLHAQIITRETTDEEIQDIFSDSCFIYALKDMGVNQRTLNKIRQSRFSETNIRFKTVKDIKDICEEFTLDISLVDYDLEASGVNKRRVLFKQGSENSIGELVIINGHIFNNRLTKITKDNIDQNNFSHLESR